MKTQMPTSTGKHQKKVPVDEVAFYYANGIRVLPSIYVSYLDDLSELERKNKLCLLPNTVLERYHVELFRRIEFRIRRIAKVIG